ncbi:MAG: hypothetical protein R2911_42785 [Caldilineaceae bacterium]
MSEPQYVIGIDLGTTHCVVAYTAADIPENTEPAIHLFEIPQVVSPGQVQALPLLPSFLLLPGPHDAPPGGLALPWQPDMDYAVGEFARSRGGRTARPLGLLGQVVALPPRGGLHAAHSALGGALPMPADCRRWRPPRAICATSKRLGTNAWRLASRMRGWKIKKSI